MREGGLRAMAMAVALLVLLLPCMAIAAETPQAAALVAQQSVQSGRIRVSLASISTNSYTLTLQGTYTVQGQQLPSGTTVKIEMSGGTVYLTRSGIRQAVGSSVTFVRQSGGLRIAESTAPLNLYPGNLSFQYSGGVAYAICTLPLEEYISGVLPYEMDESFPLEALKAQAVAARTYAIKNQRSNSLYDVTDTISHQVFRGVNYGKTRCIQAVSETKGIIIRYNGGLIDANFGASNGGQTELNSNAWGSSRAGYLAIKDDPYDLANPRSVSKSYLIYKTPSLGSSVSAYAMIRDALAQKNGGQASAYTIDQVVDVTLHTPRYATPSRLYTRMRISVRFNGGFSDTLDIPIFPTVKTSLGIGNNTADNELLTITNETAGFRVTARRYGHGVGMSQRGAEQMAQMGMGYRQILGFYYQGIELVMVPFSSDLGSDPGTAQPIPTAAPTTIPSAVSGQGRVTLADPGNRLNVRAQASLMSVVVARLAHGTMTEVVGQEGDWYHIRYGGVDGYVAMAYISLQTQPVQEDSVIVRLADPGGVLHLRKEPSTRAEVLARIPNGTVLRAHTRGTLWTEVTYQNQLGYVLNDYLSSIQKPQQTVAPTQSAGVPQYATVSLSIGNLNLRSRPDEKSEILIGIQDNARVELVSVGEVWCAVRYSGYTGYVNRAYLALSTPQPTLTQQQAVYAWIVTAQSETVNLRHSPSMLGDILAAVPRGAQVQVLEQGTAWTYIRYGGASGYVASQYLSQARPQEFTPNATATTALSVAYVVTESGGPVNLRKEPSVKADTLSQLAYGTLVQVLSPGSEWTLVRVQNLTGYVATGYLTESKPVAPVRDTTQTSGASLGISTVNRGRVRVSVGMDRVLLRQEATVQAQAVGYLVNQASVDVLRYVGDGAQWLLVRGDGVQGYIQRAEASLEYRVARVGVDSAPVWAEPNSDARTVAELSEGITVTMLRDIGNGWIQVCAEGGLTGYMQSQVLTPL